MALSYNQVAPLKLGKSNNKDRQTPLLKSSPAISIPEDTYDPLNAFIPSETLTSSSSNNSSNNILSEEAERRKRRAERFQTVSQPESKKVKNTFDPLQEQEDYSNLNAIGSKFHVYDQSKAIIGRCTVLEKRYLRLTSEPNPDLVRPPAVLNQAFKFIMDRYTKHEVNYTYMCDQLKSIRQDMRVQMIENKFTMKVYQAHARLALENDDLGEFNQCQSRLFILYSIPTIKKTCYEEFVSYLILYYVLTEDSTSITSWRLKLIKEDLIIYQNDRVQKAFQFSQAILVGDYAKSIALGKGFKGVGTKLVAPVIERERLKGLMMICQSYNQLNIKYMTILFRFQNKLELMEYLAHKQLDSYVMVKNPNTDTEYSYLDTKQCRLRVKQIYDHSRRVDIKGQV
ncbi:protein Thp3p [Monosporozyma servazzii]